jgi:hypothetical protein
VIKHIPARERLNQAFLVAAGSMLRRIFSVGWQLLAANLPNDQSGTRAVQQCRPGHQLVVAACLGRHLSQAIMDVCPLLIGYGWFPFDRPML